MIITAEKINGSIPSVAKAIAAKDEDHIKHLANAQSEIGVDFLDVCASVDEKIEVETLKWLIDLVQSVTDTPIAVDSPSAHVCAEALKFCNKPGLVNSVDGRGQDRSGRISLLPIQTGMWLLYSVMIQAFPRRLKSVWKYLLL